MITRWFQTFFAWIGDLFFHGVYQRLDSDLIAIDRRLDRIEMKRGPIAIYVMITWTGGILSRRVILPDTDVVRVRFMPEGPIPIGAWVAVIGEAHITDVTIGNMAQFMSYSSEAPFCITQTAAEVGNQISVRVKGNRT